MDFQDSQSQNPFEGLFSQGNELDLTTPSPEVKKEETAKPERHSQMEMQIYQVQMNLLEVLNRSIPIFIDCQNRCLNLIQEDEDRKRKRRDRDKRSQETKKRRRLETPSTK